MVRTVYLDLLFLVNFSMDFLCFYISAYIISVKFPTLRAIIAAILGGIYSDITLFLPTKTFLTLLIDILICIIMCAIVFGKKQGLVFSSLVYFSVSMALGGFMTALFNLLNRMGFDKLSIEEGEGDGISVWIFAAIALASAVFTLFGGKFFRKKSSIKNIVIKITHEKNTKSLSAIVDSGNLLRDPISGRACIVVDADSVCGVIPREVIRISQSEEFSKICTSELSVMKKIRLLCVHTATGEKMLVGFRADKVIIDTGKKSYETDVFLVLSKLDSAEALVPSQLLN